MKFQLVEYCFKEIDLVGIPSRMENLKNNFSMLFNEYARLSARASSSSLVPLSSMKPISKLLSSTSFGFGSSTTQVSFQIIIPFSFLSLFMLY